MTGRYPYEELKHAKREIRLLELFPIDHKLSKFRPACRMFHTSLGKDTPFEALSYVWGDQSDTRIILVNKRPFRVTRNLFDAILELRESKSLIVWIDAICINQNDDEEKGWQVGLMHNIYEQASSAIAWLGPSEDDSDTVIDYLDRLGRIAEACGLHRGVYPYSNIWQEMVSNPSYMENPSQVMSWNRLDGRMLRVSKHALEVLLHTISGFRSQDQLFPLDGLKRLFRRAWWARVWVLQEITLPECAYFCCGTKRITRRRFQAAFNAYYALWETLVARIHQGITCTPYQVKVAYSMVVHRVNLMLSMPNTYRAGKFPLVALLRATCVGSVHSLKQDGTQHLEATDPRDKIFALLGVAKDNKELEKLGVSPDYTRSIVEVYASTMVALLRQGHISMLSHCRFPQTLSNAPSWVVDWSIPGPDRLQDVEPDHLTLSPRFQASGRRSQDRIVTSRENSGLLKISIIASCYDEVLQVGHVPRHPVTGTCITPMQWLCEFLRLTYETADIYTNFEKRLQAVVRASHAAFGYGDDANPKLVNRFFDALPVFVDGLSSITDKRIKQHLRKFLQSSEVRSLLGSGCGNPSKLQWDLMRITSGRSPFVTAKGHLGLGPQYVIKGDIVAIIAGAEVPFVLRRCKDRSYIVIGEAYVDGVMNGEAAEHGHWDYIELA